MSRSTTCGRKRAASTSALGSSRAMRVVWPSAARSSASVSAASALSSTTRMRCGAGAAAAPSPSTGLASAAGLGGLGGGGQEVRDHLREADRIGVDAQPLVRDVDGERVALALEQRAGHLDRLADDAVHLDRREAQVDLAARDARDVHQIVD